MGFFTELQLRAAAYLFGTGEFAGNIARNVTAYFLPRADVNIYDLTGKTCVITGGNAGVGLATAKELCGRGCRVILACRSTKRAKRAAQEISEFCAAKGKTAGQVDCEDVSLNSLQSVRQFCKRVSENHLPIDFLILNAGIMGKDIIRRTTDDGFEEHFQVNYLSHWLIAHQVVGAQRKRRQEGAAKSIRVVFLSSMTHIAGNLNLRDLQLEAGEYSGFRAYTNSKLANILAVKQMQRYFQRESDGSEDAAVAVHPGLIQTSLAHGWMTGSDIFGGVLQRPAALLLAALSPFILEPPSSAARTVLYAALAPAHEVGGKYVAYGRARASSKASCNTQLALGLWAASIALTGEPTNAIEGVTSS